MIDTVVIESAFLKKEVADKFNLKSRKKLCYDYEKDVLLYEFTNADLEGSYDTRISIQIRNQMYAKSANDVPVLIKCPPYLRIECSIHKLLYKTNVVGGINNFQLAIKYLIKFIEKSFEVKLQPYDTFIVKRIDYSKNYYLEKEVKKDYFAALNLTSYPRRKVHRYGSTGIYVAGSSTTVKIYDKYEDFKVHDKKRLNRFKYDKNIKDYVEFIEDISKDIIRFEVEIRLKKLQYDFDKKDIQVKDIETDYLNNVYNIEVSKLLKMSADAKKIYCTSNEVLNVLKENYSNRKANVNYSFWFQYVTFGEEFVKNNYSKTTFYRIRKELKELGISLTESDINLDHNKVINFIPTDSKEVTYLDNSLVKGMYSTFLEYIA